MSRKVKNEQGNFPEQKPVRLSVSFWISFFIIFSIFIWVGVVPAIFMLTPSKIPALESAQLFSGKIGFDSASPKRGSYLTVTDKEGRKMVFSCRKSAGWGHWCLPYEYQGREAKVWWFEASVFPGEQYKFPIQIAIDAESRWTRKETLKRIRSHQYLRWGFILFEVIVLFLFVPTWIGIQRSRDAVNNN